MKSLFHRPVTVKPAKTLTPDQENEFLVDLFEHSESLRTLIINLRFFLCKQNINYRQFVIDCIRENFVPKFIRESENDYQISLSSQFQKALTETLAQAVRHNQFTGQHIFEYEKQAINLVSKRLPPAVTAGVIDFETNKLLKYGQNNGLFTVHNESSKQALEIFKQQRSEVSQFYKNQYSQEVISRQKQMRSFWLPAMVLCWAAWYENIISLRVAFVITLVVTFQNSLYSLFSSLAFSNFSSLIKWKLGEETCAALDRRTDPLYSLNHIKRIYNHDGDAKHVTNLELDFQNVPALSAPATHADSSDSDVKSAQSAHSLSDPVHRASKMWRSSGQPDKRETPAEPAKTPAEINFSSKLNFEAVYIPADPQRSNIFPIKRSTIADSFYIYIDPKLQGQIHPDIWKSFKAAQEDATFARADKQPGVKQLKKKIRINPQNQKLLNCYELKIQTSGERLIGYESTSIDVDGKVRHLIEFTMHCQHKDVDHTADILEKSLQVAADVKEREAVHSLTNPCPR